MALRVGKLGPELLAEEQDDADRTAHRNGGTHVLEHGRMRVERNVWYRIREHAEWNGDDHTRRTVGAHRVARTHRRHTGVTNAPRDARHARARRDRAGRERRRKRVDNRAVATTHAVLIATRAAFAAGFGSRNRGNARAIGVHRMQATHVLQNPATVVVRDVRQPCEGIGNASVGRRHPTHALDCAHDSRERAIVARKPTVIRAPLLAFDAHKLDPRIVENRTQLRRQLVHELGAELDRHRKRWVPQRVDPSANPVPRLQDADPQPGAHQLTRRRKPGDAGSNDQYVSIHVLPASSMHSAQLQGMSRTPRTEGHAERPRGESMAEAASLVDMGSWSASRRDRRSMASTGKKPIPVTNGPSNAARLDAGPGRDPRPASRSFTGPTP